MENRGIKIARIRAEPGKAGLEQFGGEGVNAGQRDGDGEAAAAPAMRFPQIYLSWKSGPGEVKHWKDMIARPRQAVAQWHQLKA